MSTTGRSAILRLSGSVKGDSGQYFIRRHREVACGAPIGYLKKATAFFDGYSSHVFAVLAAVILSGCAPGPPSENVGRETIERQIQTQSNGKIKLVSFTKTNGKQHDDSYQLEYKAEIEFLATGAWSRGSAMDSSTSFGFSTEQVAANALAQFTGSIFGAMNVRQGQRETVTGVLRFEKTEKGWRGQDGQVY